MINRHGVQYTFEEVDSDTYKLVGDFGDVWRCGGKDSSETIDYEDLGFVDPAGGPFIGLGSLIKGRKITRISLRKQGPVLQLEKKGDARVKGEQAATNPG